MAKPWMVDELAHAGAEHLDLESVAGYDQKQQSPDPAEDLSVLAAHGLTSASSVVDLGAGTGQFALAAARQFGLVVVVDISPAMLRQLEGRAASTGLTNLRCVQAGFLSYEHLGRPADGVYTRNALHHLPDYWKGLALARIARMMQPGAVLRLHDLIYDFQPAETDQIFERWLAQAPDDSARGYTSADLAEHIRSEHSTFRWLLEPMIEAAGFEIVTVAFSESVYGAYTCVKR